jgi:hypothetical protein
MDALSSSRSEIRSLGEFGERSGDPRCRRGVDSEFVVAAADILDEGVPGDDHLGCAVLPVLPARPDSLLN